VDLNLLHLIIPNLRQNNQIINQDHQTKVPEENQLKVQNLPILELPNPQFNKNHRDKAKNRRLLRQANRDPSRDQHPKISQLRVNQNNLLMINLNPNQDQNLL